MDELQETMFKTEREDRKLPSVTTVLKVLDKPGLLYWAAEQTAKAAVSQQDQWQNMAEQDGSDAAIKWLCNARFRRPIDEISASQLGTDVHKALELTVLNGKPPNNISSEVESFVKQFLAWLEKEQPEYEHTEVAVFNLEYGYAGTVDAIVKIGKRRIILDYKTSRRNVDNQGRRTKPYLDAAIQLAAYSHAPLFLPKLPARKEEIANNRFYFYGDREHENVHPLPVVDGTFILHITPTHCDLYPCTSGKAMFMVFLSCLSIINIKSTKEYGGAIGKPL